VQTCSKLCNDGENYTNYWPDALQHFNSKMKRSNLAGRISLGSLKLKQLQHSLFTSLLEVRNNFMRKRITVKSNHDRISDLFNERLPDNTAVWGDTYRLLK